MLPILLILAGVVIYFNLPKNTTHTTEVSEPTIQPQDIETRGNPTRLNPQAEDQATAEIATANSAGEVKPTIAQAMAETQDGVNSTQGGITLVVENPTTSPEPVKKMFTTKVLTESDSLFSAWALKYGIDTSKNSLYSDGSWMTKGKIYQVEATDEQYNDFLNNYGGQI